MGDDIATLQIACFTVGDGEYGLDIMKIKEIINPVEIRDVPRAPAFLEGIIELRGAFIPIVDLRKRFGTPVAPMTRQNKYVIVGISGHVVGLIVSKVLEVARVSQDAIGEAPSIAQADSKFFDGCIKMNDRIVLLLDLDEILSTHERAELEGVQSS